MSVMRRKCTHCGAKFRDGEGGFLCNACKLRDAVHAAISFTYVEGEEARLRARVALKRAIGWPLTDGEPERLRRLEREKLPVIDDVEGWPTRT